MYTVTLETIDNHSETTEKQTFILDQSNESEYSETMETLSDILFDLNVDFDDIEGDGDIIVDDMLIAISEEEPFEQEIEGNLVVYRICGGDTE